MKKQFFRVKQLADQTFLKAEKSDIFNHGELHIADHKVEYLRAALSAITKKIAPNGVSADIEKLMKKNADYQLGATFLEESRQSRECPLLQSVLRECGNMEQQLARDYAEHEKKIEELVCAPLEAVMENDFPNILKHKHSLRKYCLDKDSASNRYQATGKENVREDMEEADTKVEQTRDALATDMFSVLARENEISEYILQFLKLQRSYHEGALKSLQNLIPELEKKIGDSPVRRVFGTSLQEHLRITGKRVAYPLEICVTALREYAMSEEGLFRVAAGTSKVKRLRASIDSGCFAVLIPEYRDAHVLASVLKSYLRELPEPLLTYHLHKEWIEAMHAKVSDDERLTLVKATVDKLPPENRDNLSYLFQFLSSLTKHPENKMSASNIAIVLSPNLLWNKRESYNMDIGHCVTINMLVELFIKESDFLFPDDTSSYVNLPAEIFLEEDFSPYRGGHAAPGEAGGAGSPRPVLRKKKSAPVPPPVGRPPLDDDGEESNHREEGGGGARGSPLPEAKVRADGPRTGEMPRKVIGTNETAPATHKPLAQLAHKLDRSTMTEDVKPLQRPPQPKTINQSNQPQTKPAKPAAERTFTSSVVHKVNQAVNTPSVITDSSRKEETATEKAAKTEAEEGQLRRKEPGSKPEIPARPSSLSGRPQLEADRVFRKTQCSVYNVANKQQPSYINIHSRPTEPHQPGHDNNINEKERFLGHEPTSSPSGRDDNFANADYAANDERHRVQNRTFAEAPPPAKMAAKSIENIDRGGDPPAPDRALPRASHARARSDGGVIDLERGGQPAHFAARSLAKPSEPPPPPPET